MTRRDIISMAGAFCAGFGALLVASPVDKWAWWLGQVMIIAGPILMGARAATSKRHDTRDPEP